MPLRSPFLANITKVAFALRAGGGRVSWSKNTGGGGRLFFPCPERPEFNLSLMVAMDVAFPYSSCEILRI